MHSLLGLSSFLLPVAIAIGFVIILVGDVDYQHDLRDTIRTGGRRAPPSTCAAPRPSPVHMAKARLAALRKRHPSTKRAAAVRRLAADVAADADAAEAAGFHRDADGLRELLPLIDAAAAAVAAEDAAAAAAGECGVCLGGVYATSRFPCTHGVCPKCAQHARMVRCPFCRTEGRAVALRRRGGAVAA